MKKTQISLIALFCCITLATMAQIPNAGFENWTQGNPDEWASSNVPEAGLINIFQTTDRYSGELALRGDVVNFMGTPMGPVIQSGPDATGFPVSERYQYFDLYYKFTSVGGDKFSVNVAMEKNGIPIAQGAVALPANVGTYTHLSVELQYTSNEIPDNAIIQISITGPVTGPDVHIGSVMFVDELFFLVSIGTENIPVSNSDRPCYPNPASDLINFPVNISPSGEVDLKVFDLKGNDVTGRMGQGSGVANNICSRSVSNLSPGLYFYSLKGEQGLTHGKFVVNR